GYSFEDMLAHTSKYLHREAYKRVEMATLLQIDPSALSTEFIPANITVDEFFLFQRATHVFSEAQRVLDFAAACRESSDASSTAVRLGELMNQSHESCDKLFDCSCPELNELTSICLASG